MVCDRCIIVARQQLTSLNFNVYEAFLGSVSIFPEPSQTQLECIKYSLEAVGLVLINKRKDILVDQIKTLIIELVHHSELKGTRQSLINIIAERLKKDVGYISRLFSQKNNITIEKFIIQQKIEKVKELLEYEELSLNAIAKKMGYSSSAHLSGQFKVITGYSPTKYRLLSDPKRRPLDQI